MNPQSIEEHNLVERYVTGRLSQDEAAAFEEYLLEHPDRAIEVRSAQRLQRGLESVAAREMVQTSLAVGLGSVLRKRIAWMAPLILLATIVPLTLIQRFDDLNNRLAAAQQPRANTPIFELAPFRASSLPALQPRHLTLSPDFEWIVFVLDLKAPELASFRIEWLDAENSLVWEAAGVRPDPLGRLVMTLPSTLLHAGDYEIRAARSDGSSESMPTERFALRIAGASS